MSLSAAAKLNDLLVKAFDPEVARAIAGLIDASPFDVSSPEYRLLFVQVASTATVREAVVQLGTVRDELIAHADRTLAGIQKVRQLVAEACEENIATQFTQSLDSMETEIRTLAREMANSEYRAASALTAQAINDQVEALTAAARRLEAAKLGVADATKLKDGADANKKAPPQSFSMASALSGGIGAAVAVMLVLFLASFFHVRL